MPRTFKLPNFDNDFVILTPKDILTKDETWISHGDMVRNFDEIPDAVPNHQLRGEINNYFYSMIPQNWEPTKEDYSGAISSTLSKYPELIDYYIKLKEDTGDRAVTNSLFKVFECGLLYIKQFGSLPQILEQQTPFYTIPVNTEKETKEKIQFFKDVIENKGGHKIFYNSKGEAIRREKDVHILFRLVWHGTPSDLSREVDDGRGPADLKVSRGATDKTLVEFKLASNTQLKRNLENQLEIYKKASDAQVGFKVIIYFTEQERIRVQSILRELKMEKDSHVILVDACSENKPSASKA